jgi:hypothetical protein
VVPLPVIWIPEVVREWQLQEQEAKNLTIFLSPNGFLIIHPTQSPPAER